MRKEVRLKNKIRALKRKIKLRKEALRDQRRAAKNPAASPVKAQKETKTVAPVKAKKETKPTVKKAATTKKTTK
ncbi:Uncharacterised protein [Mycoplasmopsis californica]|uniref:Uncharacterized protein n=1 Tax=Mycoplasmopsis equigenitalium TaxID=114883 RepID=A0ABY5J4X3_9BACT|nr:hypothetical protein [Mycoplasmopsis equigenitalium]UUD37015.1 hypothetical protein NPA09_00345 [Mycoplasmopsis equigenitalium]VEU69686.1 Uncharacterised protein [Mycoplasmopsis californica]